MTRFRINRPLLREISGILVVAAIGITLAFQGWRSRPPHVDLLSDIDSAHQLLTNWAIPQIGSINGYNSINPAGGAWLMAPGELLFTDPRLLEYVGSASLYVGTLIGIFLLARMCFGTQCAFLSVVLYGLSDTGLAVAGSLWQRFPIHCAYVWMTYWTCQWVRRRDARYLAAAIVTLAAGSYIFLEIAPALFILVAVWLFYRPPVALRPLVVAAVICAAIWAPYVQLEFARGFEDVKVQLTRQRPALPDYRKDWCDPSLDVRWKVTPEPGSPASDQADEGSTTQQSVSRRLAERAFTGIVLFEENFKRVPPIPGAPTALLVLSLWSLALVSLSGSRLSVPSAAIVPGAGIADSSCLA